MTSKNGHDRFVMHTNGASGKILTLTSKKLQSTSKNDAATDVKTPLLSFPRTLTTGLSFARSISWMEPNAFSELRKLEVLILTNNRLTSLPDTLLYAREQGGAQGGEGRGGLGGV